jgi:assimilatory nitrate reductase catalytic subunit
VSDVQIRDVVADGSDLPALQEKLKCGTFCGSCVPDIKRMLVEMKEIAPA